MGYTHYWQFNKPKGIKAADLETAYQKAVKACNKVIKAYQDKAEDMDRLSGYSAHTAGRYGGIELNGKGEYAHETFVLREHFNQNEPFNFCKTARKPYDTAVTACLAILKYYLKDAVTVSSDGDSVDWAEGTLLARLTLQRAVSNPIPKSEKCSACGR